MKIDRNSSTLEFIDRLTKEFEADTKLNNLYDYMRNEVIEKALEKKLLRACRDIRKDFKGFKRNPNIILKNPYYQNISLKDIKFDGIEYENKILPARTCLNVNFPEIKNGYGRFEVNVGYYDKNINIPILKENDKIWMSITEMEIYTSQFAVDKAHGDVLTFGLGLGYFPYMCSLKETVNKITIVEFNPKIIKMFKTYILPQFKHKEKIEIIEGDMYEYLNNSFLDRYNYKFADVWSSNEDGFQHYKEIVKTNCDLTDFDFWIEDSIIHPTVLLISIYIKSLLGEIELKVGDLNKKNMLSDMMAIEKYFLSIDKTVTTKEELCQIITSKKVVRDILKITD